MITTRLLANSGPSQPLIYCKDNLTVANPWTLLSEVRGRTAAVKANSLDRCDLTFEYGLAMRPLNLLGLDKGPIRQVAPIDLKGKYVRVQLGGAGGQVGVQYWYGYVLEEKRERVSNANGQVVGRTQIFTAVGLEYFLGRRPIRSAFLHDGNEIGRPLDFNGGPGARFLSADRKLLANMHPEEDGNGSRCFYDPRETTASAQEWNGTRIAEHVLQYHQPVDSEGNPAPCKYVLDPSVASFMDAWRPTLRVENRTPLEVLDSLISPRRGLQWWGYYSDSDDNSPTGEYIIRVQSQAKTAVALENGGSLPACTLQTGLDTDGDQAVSANEISNEGRRNYDRIRFRGARQTTTCTLSKEDGNLEQGWPDALEAAYKEAAKDSDGYSSINEDAKKNRNDAVRREERFRDVYSLFRIPADWDGEAGDGAGGTKSPVFVDLSAAGTVTGAQEFYVPGLRVLEHLMIAEGGGVPDKNRPEYLPPIVVVKVATSPDKWQFVEKLGDNNFGEGTPVSENINARYDVHAAQEVAGIRLRSSSMPHTLAKNHFADAALTRRDEELDWETLRATVSLEGDAYAEGVWPSAVDGDAPIQEMLVDAGDGYRLDYIVTGTLIDLNEGEDVAKEVQSFYGGTIGVDSGVVTLVGDTWPDWVSPSAIIIIDGQRHKVVSRDSDTQITLQDATLDVDSGEGFELHSHLFGVLRDDRPRLIDLAKFAYQWYETQRNALSVTFDRLDFASFNLAQMINQLGVVNQQEINTNVASITWDFYKGTTSIQTAPNRMSIPELLA